MRPTQKQVFHSGSKLRWKTFVIVVRLFTFILLLGLFVTGINIWRKDNNIPLPSLVHENDIFKKILDPEKAFTIANNRNRAYKKARLGIDKIVQAEKLRLLKMRQTGQGRKQIRGGFYVNWDAESYSSLRENITKLNMVFPEWLFVPDVGDTLMSDIDMRALTLLRKHNIDVVPMVTNFYKGGWSGNNVSRIIHDPAKRKTFIASIVKTLQRYHFQGVNIDFEDLENEKTDAFLIAFQKELYQALHPLNLLVTQDIAPLNTDYNLPELAKWNDYLILMAYDQHFASSVPGPVAHQKWVEYILEQTCLKVAPEKLIVGLAGYGYDWPEGGEATDVSYQEAITTARESEGKVKYDNNGYNLNYTYTDEFERKHNVWFIDAAGNFNVMRAAADLGTAGVSLWRLGGEDARLWTFYNRPLDSLSLANKPFDHKTLENPAVGKSVDFMGEGDIMDMIATPQKGIIKVEYDPASMLIAEQDYTRLPSGYVIKKFGKTTTRKIVLSFDDGPDEKYTPQILDILKQEHVPAAFFVTGVNVERNIPVFRRIFNEGYEIGNHTFTHPNLAETGNRRAELELSATRQLIECLTGHSTVLFRPPYNADSEPETLDEILPVEIGKNQHYFTIGESIDPLDWRKDITADSIMKIIMAQESLGNIILLHDAGGNRAPTVEALPRIIKYFKAKGYTFTTIADLMGKKKEDIMPALPDKSGLQMLNLSIAEGFYQGQKLLGILFLTAIFLAIGRTLCIALLAWLQKSKTANRVLPPFILPHGELPTVSIIVPAYNEEVTVVKTLANLLKMDYPHLEIILVDDGSSDNTWQRVNQSFGSEPRLKLFRKVNGGKASALNFGIAQSTGQYIMCIDADTQLLHNSAKMMIRYFADPMVGAVAGNVKVGNAHNMLTNWQSIEYITSQNFDRRAFDYLNCITVIPGAIGMFCREALAKVGHFTHDTLAEDCDLTLRLLKAGYTVRYAPEAIALTEVPENIQMFLRQRFRWSFGIMQSFWKHRQACFNPSYKMLGWVALPNLLLFQMLLPLLCPLADLFMFGSILSGNAWLVALYYLLFTVVDAAGAVLAFRFEGEKPWKLWMLLPQRFVYRQLIYYVAVKSVLEAIRGEHHAWGKLKRTGKVEMVAG